MFRICYTTEQNMLYDICHVITCVLLCYITCVMLSRITYVMFCYITYVMLCYMTYEKKQNM